MDDHKLSRLEAIFKVANEGFATSKEVASVAVQIVKAMKSVIEEVWEKVEKSIKDITDNFQAVEERFDNVEAMITRECLEIEGKLENISLTPGPKGEDGESIEGPTGPAGENGSPDTAEQVRDKLESLKPGKRLDAEFIDGLKELIKKLMPEKNGGVRVIGGRAGIQMFVDGVKQGLIQYLDVQAGTNVTLDSVLKNGVLTLIINAAGSTAGTWHLGEKVTLAGNKKDFTLSFAPTAKVDILLDRQPQIYNLDITGTIDGVNKNFSFVDAVDDSLLDTIYANYI